MASRRPHHPSLGPTRCFTSALLGVTTTCLVACLLGCAGPVRLTLDPVGPASGDPPPERPGIGEGWLQVFNQRQQRDDGGIPYECFTPYLVTTPAGQKVQSVANRIGSMDQQPMTVALPEGQYLVYARAEGYGRVRVPVLIRARQWTQIYLTTEGFTPARDLPETDWVRLPEGPIVGRRAARLDTPPQ